MRLALYACWILFIWGHSLVQGPESSLESGFFVSLLRPLFEAVGISDADLAAFVVRKCAHFSEYAVLGLLAARLLPYARPRWLPVSASALVPFLDEAIQSFVPGRSPAVRDVLIDLAGVAAGFALFWAVFRAREMFRARHQG